MDHWIASHVKDGWKSEWNIFGIAPLSHTKSRLMTQVSSTTGAPADNVPTAEITLKNPSRLNSWNTEDEHNHDLSQTFDRIIVECQGALGGMTDCKDKALPRRPTWVVSGSREWNEICAWLSACYAICVETAGVLVPCQSFWQSWNEDRDLCRVPSISSASAEQQLANSDSTQSWSSQHSLQNAQHNGKATSVINFVLSLELLNKETSRHFCAIAIFSLKASFSEQIAFSPFAA